MLKKMTNKRGDAFLKGMEFKGDIIITDPCYIIKEDAKTDDWSRCKWGDDMEVLGITKYLCNNTEYGDWGCTTFKEETHEVLGHFCADAGLVAVFLLDEVLKYNPSFDYHLKRLWTTTLIKDFDGRIEIKRVSYVMNLEPEEEDGFTQQEDEEIRVIGKGNINFYTSQTSP